MMKLKSSLVVWILVLASFFALCCNKGMNPDDPGDSQQVRKTVWSASSASFIGENIGGLDSWKRLNERLKAANGGYGLTGRRTYDKGIPASFEASAMAGDIGTCPVSVGSFKPVWSETADGTNNEALRKFIASIPDEREVYLVFYHEPENNVTSIQTLDVLQRAFARYVDIVLSSAKPNLHPCFVLMTWTFKPQSKRIPENYNMAKYLKPGQIKEVIAGLDGYADNPAVSAKEVFEKGFATLGSWGFTRFGIFETGAHASSVPSARSEWVKGLGSWVSSRNDIEIVSWFNNGNGQHAGPTGWYLGNWYKTDTGYTWDDADGTIAAYAQLLKRSE